MEFGLVFSVIWKPLSVIGVGVCSSRRSGVEAWDPRRGSTEAMAKFRFEIGTTFGSRGWEKIVGQ